MTNNPRKSSRSKSTTGTSQVIRLLRNQQGLTIGELSELSSVSRSTISDLESGRNTNPTSTTISNIARALGLTLQEMLDMINRYESMVQNNGSAASLPTLFPATAQHMSPPVKPLTLSQPRSAQSDAVAKLLSENPQFVDKLQRIAALPQLHQQIYLYHLNYWLDALLMTPENPEGASATPAAPK